MKFCPVCKAEIENNFDLCWNCQFSFSENRKLNNSEFSETCPNCDVAIDASYQFCPNCQYKIGLNSIPSEPSAYQGNQKIDCLRCKIPMFYRGNSNFYEGANIGVFGTILERLQIKASFDLYFCPSCGKIEFFLPDSISKKK